MKKLKFLTFALFAVLACVSFASCSDDDKDEPKNDNAIIGVWELVSDTGGNLEFNSIEFKADKTAVIKSAEGTSSNNNYVLNGNKLRINLNVTDGVVDDYTDGTFSLNGNTVTYKYTVHDGEGKWHHNTEQTMVLRKK